MNANRGTAKSIADVLVALKEDAHLSDDQLKYARNCMDDLIMNRIAVAMAKLATGRNPVEVLHEMAGSFKGGISE